MFLGNYIYYIMDGTISKENSKIDTPSLLHATSKDWELVYEPAEDTFLMLDALENDLDFIKCRMPRICLEVGSGSGVIATALSKNLGSVTHFLAIDVNQYACQLTRRTSNHNNATFDVIQGDLMTCIRDFAIDLVVFNPPYVVTTSEELKSEDHLTRSWAGGKKGREVIDRFLGSIPTALDEKGFGYILLLRENDPEDVINVLSSKDLKAHFMTRRKVRGEELYIVKFEKLCKLANCKS